MRKSLVLLCLTLFSGFSCAKKQLEPPPIPTSFVIGYLTYWDIGPPFNYYALYIVRPSEAGVRIDRVLLTPPSDLCSQHPNLKWAGGLTTESIKELLGSENPCAIPEKVLRREAKRCKGCQTYSGAIVSMRATCGGVDRLIRANVFEDYWFAPNRKIPGHTLTMMELVKKLDESLKEEEPAGIKEKHADLLDALGNSVYDSLFETQTEKPSILSKGALVPPLEPSIELTSSLPVAPTTFVAPQYPPIARAAHVQGKATFTFAVDPSGKVTKITFNDAHPMLKGSIEKAVSEWQYPPQVENQTVHAALEFKLNCADSRVER